MQVEDALSHFRTWYPASLFFTKNSRGNYFIFSRNRGNRLQLYKHSIFFSEDFGWLLLALAENGIKQLRERVAPVPHFEVWYKPVMDELLQLHVLHDIRCEDCGAPQ